MEGTVKPLGNNSWRITWSGTYGSGSCELTLSSESEAELTFSGSLQEDGTWTADGGSGSGSSPVTIDSMTIRIKDAEQGSSTLSLNWKVHTTHNYGVFEPDWGDYYDTLPVSSAGANSWSIRWTGNDGDFTYTFALNSPTSATCTISGTLWEEDDPASTRINFSVTSPMTKN